MSQKLQITEGRNKIGLSNLESLSLKFLFEFKSILDFLKKC